MFLDRGRRKQRQDTPPEQLRGNRAIEKTGSGCLAQSSILSQLAANQEKIILDTSI